MKLSDELKAIKEGLKTCDVCRQPYTKYCIKCGFCGREFDDNGKLICEYKGANNG